MMSEIHSGPFMPCPAPFNLAAHVMGRASELADKVALSVMGLSGAERWSYGKLEHAVRATGTGLLERGLKPGDVMLLRLGNSVEFPIAYLGAIAAGIVPVPTSAQLTEREVQKILDFLRPAAVAADEATPCPEPNGWQLINAEALRAMQTLEPCAYEMGDPERLAYIVYTSGTSGQPRAVGHAHRAIWARQMMMQGWYGLCETDRLCHAGAFNWTFTLGTGLMDPWTTGATALIPEAKVFFEQLPLLLKRHEATLFAAAPGVYRKMLKAHPKLDLPALRHGLTAGEKMSATVMRNWEGATGTQVYEAYGMSECSTFISGSPEHPARDGCLGAPQLGRHVALVDEDGAVAQRGAEGQIAVHRSDPGLMLGYIGAKTDTTARFKGDWFCTGDWAVCEDDGQIRYLGRRDDMMNAGGYRVSPLEVEAALGEVVGVEALACTDVEVKDGVRLIGCFYVAKDDQSAALAAKAEAALAPYKRPRLYQRIEALPQNPNGKIKRADLTKFMN